MEKLLKFLSWKKWIIAVILTTINGYLLAKWYYWEIEFTAISTILWALFWVASAQTKIIYNKK